MLPPNPGLDEPGLLGKDIIPLSAWVTPHQDHQEDTGCGQETLPQHQGIQDSRLQPILGPPLDIKPPCAAATLAAAAAGGDKHSASSTVASSSNINTHQAMIFSDLYKSPRSPLSKLRHSFHEPSPVPADIDPDLLSRDKTRQKEAVKRYLADKIRNDWEFVWPPVTAASTSITDGLVVEEAPAADSDAKDPGEEADSESDAESVYSTMSEDPEHWRPRAEWTSDLSDDEGISPTSVSPTRRDADAVAVRETIEEKRARRRRAVREEMKWNPGLACFEARRAAWTGAKTVRLKPKPPIPASSTSTRRLSWWRHSRSLSSASQSGSPPGLTSPLQPTSTHSSQQTDGAVSSEAESAKSETAAPPVRYPVETMLPIPPPLLPPQNPMRASIQPSMYISLYDKVVLQNLQPSCPVNLSDMIRACVVGWKRDGEWPPKSSYPPTTLAAQATTAELLALRQRKAEEQRRKEQEKKAQAAARKNSVGAASTGGHTRRLSLVGIFGGGHKDKNEGGSAEIKENKEAKEGNSNNNGQTRGRTSSHSDEAGSSKTLFRRSLQKMLSLGQHVHHAESTGANGSGAPLSPTSPSTKEVAAAG